jgi:hypothetical protein
VDGMVNGSIWRLVHESFCCAALWRRYEGANASLQV